MRVIYRTDTHTNMNRYIYTQNFSNVDTNCDSSTSAPARPMAVGNMHQRGYPFHSMTSGHDSVMSICLSCHVYTSSCHNSDETFSTPVLCLWSISNAYHDSEKCLFVNGRARQAPLSGESTCTRHLGSRDCMLNCAGKEACGLMIVDRSFKSTLQKNALPNFAAARIQV